MCKYIEKPNLPTSKVTQVIADYRISHEAEKTLIKEGIEVIKTIPHKYLYNEVSGHPDMQIHHIGKNLFICDPFVYDYYSEVLKDAKIIKGRKAVFEKYPEDIAYNGVLVGSCFFHNLKYTEITLYEYYRSHNVKLINVKQGYSKCSVCVISENAIITSDTIIAKKANENNIDALYFNPEEIISLHKKIPQDIGSILPIKQI